ncbi:MAG: hypothetical protein LBT70_02935 [Holosporaceae bacterium]|jgi:hypothetical protein|nr:hypothetical protein [Holosporaceae bacterium]
MKQNNLFKIFSDFAKDYSQMIDLEVFETPSSPSTSAHIMHLNAMYRLHFISLVEMLLKIILKQITLKHNILFSTNIHNNHYYDNISFFIYTHLQNDLKSFSLGDFFRPMEKMFDGQKISQELQEFCSGKLHYYAFTLIQQMRIWGILNSQTTFKEYNASQITILREYDINRLQLYHLHALVFSLDNEAKRFSNPQPQISQSLSQKRENAAVKTRTNMIKKINQQLSIFASDPHFNESNADFILAAYNILQKIQDTDLQSMIGDSIHSLTDKLKIDANPDLGDSLFNEDQMSQINAFFWFPPSAQAINYHKKALEAFLLSKESAPSDEDNLSSIDLDNIHQWGIINS